MRSWFARFIPSTGTVTGLLLTVVVWQLFLFNPLPLRRLELLLSDLRFRVRGALQPGPEVVIAAIDEKSIDALGRWPWPYTTQAALVNRLVSYGAAAIGYDVVFSDSDTTHLGSLQKFKDELITEDYGGDAKVLSLLDNHIAGAEHDRIFAEALRSSDRVILGYFFHWDAREVAHLSPENKKKFRENIRGSELLDVVLDPPGVKLQELLLPEAKAVESNIAILSQAVCTDGECRSGFFSSSPDVEDGVIRRYPLLARATELDSGAGQGLSKRRRSYRHPVYPPLALRLLERYLQGPPARVKGGPEGLNKVLLLDKNFNKKAEIPIDAKGRMLINFLGPSVSRSSARQPGDRPSGRRFGFPYYSIVDIIKPDPAVAPPTAFEGKIVLIGATATGLADLRITPVDPNFPGVETHATVIDNILRQRFLQEPWWSVWYIMGSIFLIGIFLTLVLPRLHATWSGIGAGLLGLSAVALNYFLFVNGLAVGLVYPLLTTVVVAVGMTIFHYAVAEKNTRFLRKTFSTYLHPALIEQMAESRTDPELGGDSGIRTAYFTDIASFSSFSEILSAAQLVELLNEYLTAMTDILEEAGGTLDKFEGDAIVAFFGAPLPMEDHAARALRTALSMQQALVQLRQKWTAEGDKWPDLVRQMRMRIGVCAGDIVIGNMGSRKRFNYTMMGDVVNTAARLEASAKQYGIYIQCPVETIQLAGLEDFEWREIDRVLVVGKSEPLATVEIMAHRGQLAEELVQMRGTYHQGVALYKEQEWEAAKARFVESEKFEEVFPKRPTTPSRIYLERCDYFTANPPGKNWDGVWKLTEK